jgi:3-methylcrotonyl-CoA carboxylase alpha subunit
VTKLRRLLVANRGEIAVRIFRTCRRLGIETIAVATPDDAGAFHTRVADEARSVGSYLSRADLVEAALAGGADALHPGYGFLAEDGDFAAAVEQAGITWVGPSPAALHAAGDKLEARKYAAAAGVPLVPAGSVEELGFPLLVKASAGGGGRGLRVVESSAELDAALEAARREAQGAFGDDSVFFERYLEQARHVEVQLLGDAYGTVLALGERDCSVQRRHQKVLEETPCPSLDDSMRQAIYAAAIALARAVGYRSAGTAEFLLADGAFFFLELNARIQVEHPVTETVTGVDLVEQQLRIAAGERLALAGVDSTGHAVEVRLYAEHPLTFLPQPGRVVRLDFPETLRVDSGVEAGDEIPVAYDSLVAKIVAHADTRDEALDELSAGLQATIVRGVTTNLPFLRWLVDHPEVRAGRATTAFLKEHPPLSRYPRARAPWARYWRLNRDSSEPVPPPRAPPQLDSVEHVLTGQRCGESMVRAPMPGTVVRVLTREGDRVEARQPLVILEAMKMETPLSFPFDAIVRRVHVSEGERVAGGDVLLELT